jgi:hypothetical protein
MENCPEEIPVFGMLVGGKLIEEYTSMSKMTNCHTMFH